MIFETLVVLVVIYDALYIFFTLGLLRIPFTKPIIKGYPTISILISSRNESTDLPSCIKSLTELNYPKDRLQIILIDDYSTDNTAEILKKAAQEHKHIEFYDGGDFPATPLEAKARGIARAATKANGEWLFITDADAQVPETWLTNMLFGVKETTGLIVGMFEIKNNNFKSTIEKVTGVVTMPIGFGLGGWGIELLGLGPNMAIRKDIYDKEGGLEKADFTVAEDQALFMMVKNQGKRAKYHSDSSTIVKISPVPTYKHIFSQQRRWIKGGFEGEFKDWVGFLFLFGYGLIFSLLFIYACIFHSSLVIIPIILKLTGDFILCLGYKLRIKGKGILRLTPLIFLYTFFTFTWLPLSFLFNRKIVWMGEGYQIDYD